ncbi:MAG: TIGR00730 family Rossman fold protein [Candidatus Hydrogenedentes bacterium]|nr:TIGR00730 family Rossman fold protein [Candidatus Hydrogenedentota bacterium]
MQGLCVYCASSNNVDAVYFDAARALGREMARRGLPLIYGGGNVGLMGALATAVHAGGGQVIGVIPHALRDRELAYLLADELIITPGMRERKAEMERRALGFVALPGGLGTLEEVLEVLTSKQLQYHAKPIVFLNTAGFFDPLFSLFDHMREHRFTTHHSVPLYQIAGAPLDIFAHLDS